MPLERRRPRPRRQASQSPIVSQPSSREFIPGRGRSRWIATQVDGHARPELLPLKRYDWRYHPLQRGNGRYTGFFYIFLLGILQRLDPAHLHRPNKVHRPTEVRTPRGPPSGTKRTWLGIRSWAPVGVRSDKTRKRAGSGSIVQMIIRAPAQGDSRRRPYDARSPFHSPGRLSSASAGGTIRGPIARPHAPRDGSGDARADAWSTKENVRRMGGRFCLGDGFPDVVRAMGFSGLRCSARGASRRSPWP
jgi:hypothetical protein